LKGSMPIVADIVRKATVGWNVVLVRSSSMGRFKKVEVKWD